MFLVRAILKPRANLQLWFRPTTLSQLSLQRSFADSKKPPTSDKDKDKKGSGIGGTKTATSPPATPPPATPPPSASKPTVSTTQSTPTKNVTLKKKNEDQLAFPSLVIGLDQQLNLHLY